MVALGLLGFDQALTREAAAAAYFPRFGLRALWVSARAVTLGAITGLILWSYLDLGLSYAAALVAATLGVAVSTVVSGVLRAASYDSRAAFAQQGHRLLTGLGLVCFSGLLTANTGGYLLAGSALVVATLSLFWSAKLLSPNLTSPIQQSTVGRLGYAFALGMLTLAATDWVDQLLVAQQADLAATGIYSQAKLVAVYPMLSLGSVLGFLALPWVAARRDEISAQIAAKLLFVTGGLAAGLGLLAFPIALGGVKLIFDIQLDAWTVSFFSIYGAVRLFYVVPSALSGGLCSPPQLGAFGVCTLITLPAQIGAFLLFLPAGTLTAAIAGSLLGITIRTALAILFTFKAIGAPRS
ncbi:hypothetical protein GCM10009737_16860 [Nocardioides lentus]|uniref:Polysaccharide biosynthesis protein n=1 Tax=Nocardioides lentus TaxID=338077 RepID=A0ABP5AQJ9_9ACTN